jgi:DNA-binding XRE family transcriptional regulator
LFLIIHKLLKCIKKSALWGAKTKTTLHKKAVYREKVLGRVANENKPLTIVCRFVITNLILLQMEKNILQIFGDNVRKYRLKMQLSQEDFAELANVHRTYVGMIERAEKNITLLNMQKFAKALQVTIPDLLQDE